ncbi:MAG: Holliday junction resolvase RuvX [Desulfovibrio sp.]|nr:Holliday junction resolvase RuvX [Desulfovibrio sp.]
MKYLAIDYGEKRSGLALTDSAGKGAFPRHVHVMAGKKEFVRAIAELAKTEKITALVLGLPLRLNGEKGESAERVIRVAGSFFRALALPVYLMPETLSSFAAEERLREAGFKGNRLRLALDGASAVLILESFLNLPEERRASLLFSEQAVSGSLFQRNSGSTGLSPTRSKNPLPGEG